MQVDNAIAANHHRRRVAAIAVAAVLGFASSAPMAANIDSGPVSLSVPNIVGGIYIGPAGGPACAVNSNIIVDGGFEANTDAGTNPNWDSTSTAFGNSLCTLTGGCSTIGGGTAAPHAGNGWGWFDGSGDGAAAEVGTASQTVTLPAGATASLSFFQRFGLVTAPTSSVMTVTVDGIVVQTINEPAVADAAYIQRTVDLSAFATGTPRLLSFNYSRPAGTSFSDNATVDDVALAITACPGATPPPVLQGAKSRKTHGATIFDLPLP